MTKRLVRRFPFPRSSGFRHDLGEAFVEAMKDTSRLNVSIRSLCQTWLAVCPHTYFADLFLQIEGWNTPFVRAFRRSRMIDAQSCFQWTQAFSLRHLFRIIAQDERYGRAFSRHTITTDVLSHMTYGKQILAFDAAFEAATQNMISLGDDFSMSYVEKILQIQYPDKQALDPILTSLWMNGESLFGLVAYTAESIERARYIDSQSISRL